MLKVEFDKYSFIINGKSELIRCAAVHYFRIPGEKVWVDRLTKLKYAGYNALDIYLYWGYHSPAPGKYDFTGIRDINKLAEIANDMGFYIVARPGPYINAETSGGGFPGWLLARKDITLRNRRDMDFIYCKEYMKAVREWYNEIIPRINNFPNAIAVQVENEYSTNEAEPEYMQELIDIVHSHGCTLPVMHNDMYAVGFYADLVDIFAIDNYSVTYFDKPWQSFPEVFAVLDSIEENLRVYCQNSPFFIAELQAGWFDKWGGDGYEKMREILGRQHLDIVTKTSLSQGVTVFTHYMGCGGTNWGNIGSTEVYTSYDFASPITEEGLPTDRFFAARNINNFLQSFDISQTNLATKQPKIETLNPASSLQYKLRESIKDNSRWLFIRNDSLGSSRATINDKYEIDIDPQEMMILPSDLTINDVSIEYSTLPLFAKLDDGSNQVIFPRTNHCGEICLYLPENYKIMAEEADNLKLTKKGNLYKIKYTRSKKQQNFLVVLIEGETRNTRFIFLSEDLLDYTHIVDNRLLIGPEYITNYDGKLVGATNGKARLYSINTEGKSKLVKVDKPEGIDNIKLNWENYKVGKEIDTDFQDITGWKKAGEYLDSDYNSVYEGYAWYKAIYTGCIDKLTIDARHCFAVYLNGEEVYSNDTFNSISGKDTDKPVTFELPEKLQKKTNQLVLLIQSMGHCKGFEDDAANPRGLLSYETLPEIDLVWYIKEGLTAESLSDDKLALLDQEVKNDNIMCSVTKFNFSCPEKHQIPLGIVFKNPPFNKASIYLNDILIGQYWRDKGPQTRFYMPESFYNQDGQPNTIKLVIWHRSIDKETNYTRRLSDANIFIEPFGLYKLTELKEL